MKAPRARAHESSTRTGEKPKNSTTKGAGGVPQIFFTLNLILFVSINSVQNFKTVALPLLGEKFVVVVVGGGGWVVLKPILVFSLGLDQAEQLHTSNSNNCIHPAVTITYIQQ